MGRGSQRLSESRNGVKGNGRSVAVRGGTVRYGVVWLDSGPQKKE